MDKFKGYYFKCSSSEHSLALIPASHGNTASLQIITEKCSHNIKLGYLKFGDKIPQVKTNAGVFSEKGIKLNINNNEVKVKGLLSFGKTSPISYDIMGPFALLSPILQCRHRVISMYHTVNGKITVNNETYLFKDGNGYIEGDEGTSFPHSYLWMQCFWKDVSIMLSSADVPLFGTSIRGVIGIIAVKGKEYRFATYLGAKTVYLSEHSAVIKQGDYTLSIKNLSNKGHRLFAPKNSNMNRIIRENVKCRIYVDLKRKNKTLLSFISSEGSFECEI